jgi:adenylate cyclase
MLGSPEISADMAEVLAAHFGGELQRPRVTRSTLDHVRRFVDVLGLAPDDRDPVDPEARALLALIGVDHVDPERLARDFAESVDEGLAAGVPEEELRVILQAYLRGIARMAAAEAEVFRLLAQTTPKKERAALLDDLLGVMLPLSIRGFTLLHEAMLHDALVDALSLSSLRAPAVEMIAVALVDLQGSTEHLVHATHLELEQLADGLFEAGQAATAGRAVAPVKYVGDGVFLAGREPREVAAAALDALAHLGEFCPLDARAGLAQGEVLQRAGDIFGLPVNLAQLLTKSAATGTLLAQRDVALLLPRRMRGATRPVTPHPVLGEIHAVEIRLP